MPMKWPQVLHKIFVQTGISVKLMFNVYPRNLKD
jgi:hypothetical protein